MTQERSRERRQLTRGEFRLSVPTPLPEAVAAGLFGVTTAGPIEPDEPQVRALVAWFVDEVVAFTSEAARREPSSPARERLRAHVEQLLQGYEEAFGDEARRELEELVTRLSPDRAMPPHPQRDLF